MEYFLFAILLITVIAVLVFHAHQASQWREERAYLLNVAVSKDATDFSRRVNPVPADGPAIPSAQDFWDRVPGYEEQVGI